MIFLTMNFFPNDAVFAGKMRELVVSTWYNCDNTPEELVGEAVAHLEKVKMVETCLSAAQLTAIFTAGSVSNTLTEADFTGSQIQGVSGTIIGKFASNMVKFTLGKQDEVMMMMMMTNKM